MLITSKTMIGDVSRIPRSIYVCMAMPPPCPEARGGGESTVGLYIIKTKMGVDGCMGVRGLGERGAGKEGLLLLYKIHGWQG